MVSDNLTIFLIRKNIAKSLLQSIMVNNDSSDPSGPCGQWSKHFVVLLVSGPSGEWSKWSVPVASGPIGPSGQ